MKKLFFGISIFFGGLLGVLSLLITSIFRPFTYNEITGLNGFILATGLTSTFNTLKFMITIGLIIMLYEAYLSNLVSNYLNNSFKNK